ncbi:uncharacterized protein [Littorina saxatilis]|uniref:Uncharacterized protein n=1 Tax=Littorina saxatilis TaxID=31220 RepID=A0AAN9AKD8_9CAEN
MSLNKQLLTCKLCLEVFKKPKLLPCFHSYCEECLKNLAARHGGRSFPCPNCRTNVPVPQGGVSVFQSNFYIDSAELERAKRKSSCTTHAKNDLVSFCSTCDLAICVECMLEQHKTHDIQAFGKQARLSKDQLRKDKDWLCETERSLQARMIHAKQNRQALQDKVEEVKTELKTRCAQLVSKAEQHRDEELAKVDALAKELDSTEEDAKVTETLREKCKSLKESLATVQGTLDREDDFEIVTLAKEIRDGKGRSLDMVPEHWPKDVFPFPALQAEDISRSIASAVSSLVGYVTTRSMSRTESSSLYIVETIKCSRPNIHCFSILEADEVVCVSYEQDDAPVQRFNKHGVLIETTSDLVGKVAFHSSPGGECLYITPQKGKQVLCAKFNHSFVLERDHSGKSVVKKVDVKSKATLTTEWNEVFTFTCSGDLVAFDTSASETKFALIEESQSDLARCLKIYHMANSEPTSSFSFKSFKPSDVCFCKIEGTEVCLVADETHNSIRMFNDKDGSMVTFIPLTGELGQPTALNTDKHERLWIGCRDGRIFRCQPKSSKQQATRADQLPLGQN